MNNIIVFTGGHHNSTLEIAKEIQKEGVEAIWLGHKFEMGDGKSLSAEYQEVTKANIKFLELKTGRFYKKINLTEGIKIAFGFFQSLYYLLKFKPRLIFSSGGFMSVPVVVMGYFLKIPSITHEQTVISGWANKAISPFVKKILLTHQSSLGNYPPEKSVVVGLPVRSELLDENNNKFFQPKLLFITCGKQGSHLVNQAIFPLIPELVKNFTVVHQIGSNVLTKDLDRARRIKEKLEKESGKYLYAPYYFGKDSATYLRSADLVISRAGAHTVYELILLNKKSILIPISWVSHKEQEKNASLAAQQIKSFILNEKDLSSETLMSVIKKVNLLPKQKLPAKLKNDATERIVEIIKKELV